MSDVFVDGDGVVLVGNRVKPRMSEAAYEEKLADRGMLPTGEKIADPVPMDAPLGYVKQPSMVEHVRNLIRSENLRREAEAEGNESFEEADDFNVADDLYPTSAFEVQDEEVFEPSSLEPVATARAASTAAPAAAPVEGAGGAAGAPAPSPGPAVSSST